MLRQIASSRIAVDRENDAAGCTSDLHGEQSNWAEAVNDDRFSKSGRSKAKTLKADGSQWRKCSRLEGDTCRNLRSEGLWNSHVLGVRTIRHDAISRRKSSNQAADFADDTGLAVAQGNRRAQLRSNCLERRDDAVSPHFVERLNHFVGLRARLLDPSRATKLHKHSLSARRDDRSARLHHNR